MRAARDPGAPTLGATLLLPWCRAERTLRLDGGASYAPWTPELVVDPGGFRAATVGRRLRREGEATYAENGLAASRQTIRAA